MLTYLILFVVFGFIGWAVDTLYCSYHDGHYSSQTYLPYFAIIYAFGGILLLLLFKYTQVPFIADIVIGGAAATLLEFIGGWFCHNILKQKVWDYSGNPYNYYGHIDAEHTIYWFILTGVVRVVFPYLPI